MSIKIRKATAADVPAIFRLVRELAAFERAPEEVWNTEQRMLEEGFGATPYFFAFVAEEMQTAEIQGMAVYHWAYSTWKGKYIYLDDLYVVEALRGKGVGKQLMDALMEEAKALDASGVKWQVLDWNTQAIEFYKKYDVTFDPEWINCRKNLRR
ncbi:MAG: GNAT family N-acetyltransferase [Chitinophagales bacterium]